jgi:hypothetical protein
MKNFLFTFCLFIAPIVALILIKQAFYVPSGDLGRLSKTIVGEKYRDYESTLVSEFNDKRKFKQLTEIKEKKDENKTRVLIIGDSFSSGQGNFGYVNQLAAISEFEVVLYQDLLRKKIEPNPILALSGLINGGYFQKYEFDFVVLQNVEREFLNRSDGDIDNFIISLDSIENKIREPLNTNSISIKERFSHELNDFMLFYQFNCLYQLNNRAFNSDVYKFPLSQRPFSYGDELLVYHQDLAVRKISPSREDLAKSVEVLNQLSRELSISKIRLISIIAPDKYDMYYSQIEKRENFPEPTFFKEYKLIVKDHIELNCYNILSDSISSSIKDIYFYDNTHWSPIGHEIISTNLELLIKRLHNTK